MASTALGMYPKVFVSEFIMMYTLYLNLIYIIYFPVIFGVILALAINLSIDYVYPDRTSIL